MYRRWFSLVCGSLNLNLWRLPIKDLFNGRNHDRFANFRWRLRYFPCLKWYNLQWHLVRLRFQCFTYQFLGASISGERYRPSSISGFINKALLQLLLLLWQLNDNQQKKIIIASPSIWKRLSNYILVVRVLCCLKLFVWNTKYKITQTNLGSRISTSLRPISPSRGAEVPLNLVLSLGVGGGR